MHTGYNSPEEAKPPQTQAMALPMLRPEAPPLVLLSPKASGGSGRAGSPGIRPRLGQLLLGLASSPGSRAVQPGLPHQATGMGGALGGRGGASELASPKRLGGSHAAHALLDMCFL